MPFYSVAASGHTHIILLLNMRRFLSQDERNRQRFESLRGTDTLHQIIQGWRKNLSSQSTFSILQQAGNEIPDEETMTPEEIGFATGVFRSIAREQYFDPVYKVNKEAFHFPPDLVANLQFKKLFLPVWERWEVYIRPSMTGFFVVRLTWHYPKPRFLLQIARETHRLQSPFDVPSALQWREKARREYADDPERLERTERSISCLLKWLGAEEEADGVPVYYPVHWRLAMEVINEFVRVLSPKISYSSGRESAEIPLAEAPISPSIPLHDIYILHHFDRLYVPSLEAHKAGGSEAPSSGARKASPPDPMRQVPVNIIRNSKIVRNQLTNLLEGSLLRPLGDPQKSADTLDELPFEFPSPRWKLADELLERNLATWSDEFCILGPRLGIIIPSQKYEGYELGVSTLPKPTLKVKYSRYWEAIERLVEFVFETRVLAQLIESDSYRLLQDMANKLEEVRQDMYRGNVKVDETLRDHAIRAAHLMRLSALVQSLAHPFFWSRAEYAARKAQSLIEELDMPRILEHIQHNIEKVSDLASHVDEIYVADLAEQSNQRASSMSILLTAASLILVWLVFPSFLQDWKQICKFDLGEFNFCWINVFLGGMIAVLEVTFSAWLLCKESRIGAHIRSIISKLFD
jgi:hypothetical protein